MKALFVTAGVLIITFFAGAAYIAISTSPETPQQKACRESVATQFHGEPRGYTEFGAMLRDARKRGDASPHAAMLQAYQSCLEPRKDP